MPFLAFPRWKKLKLTAFYQMEFPICLPSVFWVLTAIPGIQIVDHWWQKNEQKRKQGQIGENSITASLVNKFYSHAFITLPNLPSVSLALFFTCTPLSTSAKGNGTHGRIGVRLTSCLDSSGSLSNRYLTGRITSGSLSSLAGLQCMESWSEI